MSNQHARKVIYHKGQFHCETGPAIEYWDGSKEWFINGLLHRADGPAIDCPDGFRAYYINGVRHRSDGPAVEYGDGDVRWCLFGKEYSTIEEFCVAAEIKDEEKTIFLLKWMK